MRLSKDEIIADIEARIRVTGGGYPNWCVGIAKDSQGPLFESHLREDMEDGWLYREAFMPSTARDVLEHFLKNRRLAQTFQVCVLAGRVKAYDRR